ncbi:aminoacyl-tRNA hydrolase [bacterium]|nr:aminoacyl-tRNA hydrolase [bacterium]
MIRAIVGLGNPLPGYYLTRHNLGRMAVEAMRRKAFPEWKTHFWKNYLWSQNAEDQILVLSKTYMNLSGKAVLKMAKDRSVKPEEILVVMDDCSLPLGKLRYRASGSDGGHHGLGSILEVMGTKDVPRLRMGVGADPLNMADYVLSEFPEEERETVEAMTSYLSDLPEKLRLNEAKTINEINNWRAPQSIEPRV